MQPEETLKNKNFRVSSYYVNKKKQLFKDIAKNRFSLEQSTVNQINIADHSV